jgi:DNA primase
VSIPDEIIERVRDAADIVEIIGEHVDLRRTGTDYRGPCPFHGGQKRNFAVIPKKQMFYCFVCHEAGDVFSFLMKHFGMEYPQAVRAVAEKMGITVPERSTGGPDPREPLYSAVAVAADWYARRLRDGKDAAPAREYLKGRGFDLEAAGLLGLGFAPRGDEFLAAMKTLGIPADVLGAAGLVSEREDGSIRPRFWGRVLFPIHDLRARPVGFGGRVLGDGEPKYLNSPESEIFHKGKLLYHLHDAKHAMRRAGRAVVVEGYFDAIRLVEAGVDYVVAPLGTALTPDQAALLKRYAQEVILLYDSDQAGLRATFRAADELLRASVRTLVATLPAGEDPDTLVVHGGPEAIRALLDDAIDVFERKLQLIERKGWLESVAGRRRALDRLLPTLRATRDPVMRDLYVTRASQSLGITPDSVRREAEAHREGRIPRPVVDSEQARPAESHGRWERRLLVVMVHEPTWRSRVVELVGTAAEWPEPHLTLYRLLREQPEEVPAGEVAYMVDGAAQALLLALMEEPWGDLNVDAEVNGAINKLKSRRLGDQRREIMRQMPLSGDAKKESLLRELSENRLEANRVDPGSWSVNR